MSSYANFFIEVKNKENGKWELLKGYYPFVQKEYTDYELDMPVKKLSEPDLICADGSGLTKMGRLWRQGTVRDLFSRSYFNDTELADRGFPADMSEDAKAYFDAKLKKIEDENEAYFAKYGQKKTWGGKWWWGESYVTLSELEGIFDKKLEKWKNDLKKYYSKKLTNSILVKKNDELYNLVNKVLETVGGKPKKERKVVTDKEEIDDVEGYIDYLLDEEIWDLFQIHSFFTSVNDITEILTNDGASVRLIVWCD